MTSPDLRIISDLARFDASSVAERLALAAPIAELAGPGFRPVAQLVGRAERIALDHALTGMRFIVVPGGRFEMGLTPLDVERAEEACTDFESGSVLAIMDELEERCSPVHEVVVAPFLLAASGATYDELMTLTSKRYAQTTPTPGELPGVMKMLTDLRLPSEAELEYVGREGGRASFLNDFDETYVARGTYIDENGWGFDSLTVGSWAADEWHPTYEGAPDHAVAWRANGTPGVYRGCILELPRTDPEILYALAATRGRYVSEADEWGVCLRFACDLRL